MTMAQIGSDHVKEKDDKIDLQHLEQPDRDCGKVIKDPQDQTGG